MATKKRKTMKGKADEFYLILPDVCNTFRSNVHGTKIDFPYEESTYMDCVHVVPATVDIEDAFNQDAELEEILEDMADGNYHNGAVAIVKVKITDIFFAEKHISLKISRPEKKKVAKKKTTKK